LGGLKNDFQPYPAGVMPANYGEVLTDKEISTIIQWLKGR
jgi:hypothetical protein